VRVKYFGIPTWSNLLVLSAWATDGKTQDVENATSKIASGFKLPKTRRKSSRRTEQKHAKCRKNRRKETKMEANGEMEWHHMILMLPVV